MWLWLDGDVPILSLDSFHQRHDDGDDDDDDDPNLKWRL